MKILFVTDLHGSHWKYDKILALAKEHCVNAVINGGDMLPKTGDLFHQDKFITGYLQNHFTAFDQSGIHYLCYLGNDDLKIFDPLFEETCRQFAFVLKIHQKPFT
jgi:Icc-related predicted phosphoesterase